MPEYHLEWYGNAGCECSLLTSLGSLAKSPSMAVTLEKALLEDSLEHMVVTIAFWVCFCGNLEYYEGILWKTCYCSPCTTSTFGIDGP